MENRIIYFLFMAMLSACHSGSSTSSVERTQEVIGDTIYSDTNAVDDELSPETKESLDRILEEKMRIDVSDTSKTP